MPAQRIEREVNVALFDVVGQDADEVPHFIRHIGLAEARINLLPGESLLVTHMGPPFGRVVDAGPIQIIGSVPLTTEETGRIGLFVDEVASEYEHRQVNDAARYIVRPSTQAVLEPDGTPLFRRFSCAGFVLEAYRNADIHLLDTDESQLPSVGLDLLSAAYPAFAEHLQHPRFRRRLNLPGDGPWPVVLPGYVIHALNRSEADIRLSPYRAKSGDEFFPAATLPTTET